MADEIEVATLQRSFVLSSLSVEQLQATAKLMARRSYRRGETIFHEGDAAETLHVILEGHVKVVRPTESGEAAVLNVLGPGDLFGELALLDDAPRSASIIALEATKTAALRRAEFRALLRRSPGAVDGLLATLARMVRRLTGEVADLMALDQQGHLAKKLLELAEAHGRIEAGAVTIEVPLSQDELAMMIGASRPRVNQLLGIFEAQGAIKRARRRIVIRDADALRRRIVP